MTVMSNLRNRGIIAFISCFVFLAFLTTIGVGIAQTPGSAGDVTADLVLGQADFTHSNTGMAPNQILFENPTDVAIDRSTAHFRVYVAIQGENRVLGWDDATGLANGAKADLVLGQTNFTNINFSPTVTDADFNSPTSVAVDSKGNVYVSDTANGRVLEFNTPFAKGCTASSPCEGQAANLVLGKGPSGTDFASFGCNTVGATVAVTAATLCDPKGLAFDSNDNLYVGDWQNYRVLEYDNPLGSPAGCTPNPDGTGCPGDVVADREWGFGTTGNDFIEGFLNGSSSSFGATDAVAIDSAETLYVADSAHSTVYTFKTALTNFTSNFQFGGGAGPSAMSLPQGLTVDSKNNLYVSDSGENRVLEFDQPTASSAGCPGAGTSPGCPGDTVADLVFGQGASGTDFTDAFCNDDSPLSPTAVTLCFNNVSGIQMDPSNDLWVADYDNNRVLEYLQPLASTSATATPTATPTATSTSSRTATPTATATATATSTAATPTVTPTPTAMPTQVLPPNPTINHQSLAFGSGVTIGKTSKPMSITIKNGGSKKKGAALIIEMENVSPSVFALKSKCVKTLKPGKSCKVSVTFKPTDTSSQTGTLMIIDNAANSPQHVGLSGMGKAPK
jgi:hypothetical protein